MIELTNKQKARILQVSINRLKNRDVDFICPAIRWAYRDVTKDKEITDPWDIFPELLNYKPKDIPNKEPWFSKGNIFRISVLEEILEKYIDKPIYNENYELTEE